MKYIAFDIEAANGYKPYSICSIGVVEADENFEVLTRRNIWINPKTKYNLNGTRENVGINLNLDKKLLDSSPDFTQSFEVIVQYLTDSEGIVIGHAVDSDVRMLNAACAKYRLPCITFDFVCTQLLYKMYKGDKDVKALSKIASDIGLTYIEHNSEEDAWMSLMTLAYIVKDSGLSLNQLMEKYCIRVGNNRNFQISRCVSVIGQCSSKKLTKASLDNLRKIADSTKCVSYQYQDKVVAIARSIELMNEDFASQLVERIVARGGRYTTKLSKCNLYITADKPLQQDAMRQRHADQLQRDGQLQIQSLCELLTEAGEII